tara:strand:+ start:929 stop:1795 length:867 start_codon:yes stop_codon:yes gene_type:complete
MNSEINKYIRYTISILIVVLTLPISDSVLELVSNILLQKKFLKYKNLFGNIFLTLFVKTVIITSGLLIAMTISGVSIKYILGGIGIISFLVPLTLQGPCRDLVCGVLLIAFDKIRVGELVKLYDSNVNIDGQIQDIQIFTTQLYNPLTSSIIEIPNSSLWDMSIHSITRSPNQKIKITLLVSNRNNIGMIETVIRKILNEKPEVNDIKFSWTEYDERGLKLVIAVDVNTSNEKYYKTENMLYKHLRIGLQDYGIIYADGVSSESTKNKFNVVTPIILDSFIDKCENDL